MRKSCLYQHPNLPQDIRGDRIAAWAFARIPPARDDLYLFRVLGSGKNIHGPDFRICFSARRLHARDPVFDYACFVARGMADNALNPRFW